MRLFRILRIFIRGKSGIGLIETAVALAVLGTIAVVFISGLIITTQASFKSDQQTTAESIARMQMEWVQNTDYTENATGYSPAPLADIDDYDDYSVNIIASPLNDPDDGIQKITITVSRSSEQITSLESYKVDR